MSYETFEVGEVAIYWNTNSRYHRFEVTITGPLAPRIGLLPTGELDDGPCYEVDGDFGSFRHMQVTPDHLRKKRPPREDLQLVRWSECPWQPEKVSA